jgi:hypothetical protein
MRLGQNEIEKVTIYFKNGERVEFTDILTANVSCDYHAEWGRNADYEIELMNPIVTRYTKRTSKRYKKNRKGYR